MINNVIVKLHIYMYVIENGYKVVKSYKRIETTRFIAGKEIQFAKNYLGKWYAGSMIRKHIC